MTAEAATLTVALEQPQLDALDALVRGATVCIPWGRGGGKSWFQRLVWYLLVSEWDARYRTHEDDSAKLAPRPGIRIVLLMPTLVQAKKVHADLMMAELADEWVFLGAEVNKTEWRVRFPGGSWIQWVSADTAQSQRGLRCDVVCVDECDDIDPEVIDAIVQPWFSEPHSLSMLLVGGTPRRGRYGLLYRTHRRGTDPELQKRFGDHKSFHATCYDFPTHIKRSAIEKARRGDDPTVTPEIFWREWMCNFDAAQGLVYSMFDLAVHVADPPVDAVFSTALVGADWGWEDPGCYLQIGIVGQGADAVAYIFGEVYASKRDEDWWIAQARPIVAAYPTARWYGDPSRPDRVNGLKSKAGARIGDVDNSIEDGVGVVANLLVPRPTGTGDDRRPRLFVSPSCVNTLRELGLYRRRRDPRNIERVLDDIEDKNNHAMDAMRYPLFAHFRVKPSSGRSYRES